MKGKTNKDKVIVEPEPIQEELQQIQVIKPKLKPNEIARKLSNDVLNSIEEQIISNKLNVAPQKRELKLQAPVKPQEKKLQQIIHKKEEMLNRLQMIQKQEQSIKRHHNSTQNIRNFKSQFTKEDFDEIKKIKETAQKFEKQLEIKTQIFEEKMKKYKEQEKQLRQRQRLEKQQARKEQIAQRLEQIKARQQFRQQKFEQDKNRFAEIKKKKWLHEQINENWKQNQLIAQHKRQQFIQQLKKQQNLNIESIKQHERKYQEIIQRQKQQRYRKASQLKDQFKEKSMVRFHTSKFLNFVMEEQEKRKQQEEQRKLLHKNISDKRMTYSEKVRSQYKPKVTSNSKFKYQQKKIHELRSMSTEEIHKRGNEYMKNVHASIGTVDIEKSKVSIPVQKQKGFKYPDYLTQNRMGRTVDLSPKDQLAKIKQIMNKTNESQEQKFFKAKLLAKHIQEKNGKSSKNLVESINAKLIILKELAQE